MRCSAVFSISDIRWLETKTVRPSAASAFIRFLIHKMPSGSSPLTGSSNMSTSGSPSIVAAIPSRWLMPREKPLDRLRATSDSPTTSSTSSTRFFGRLLVCARAQQVVVGAAPAVHRLGVEQGADLAHRVGQTSVPLAIHADRAGVRVVKAEDQSHRGGLTSAVRAEEAGHLTRLDAERQVVDGHLLAVSFREPPYLDHGIYPLLVKGVPQCAPALPSAASAAVMNGRACLSRASHQRCGPAASRDSPAAMRPGSSRRKPAGGYPEVLPRMGLPAPFPRGRGPRSPVYTSVRTLTNRARPVRRTSLRRDRDQAGGGYCRPLATWASVPRRPATRRCRPAGRAGHDNGQT